MPEPTLNSVPQPGSQNTSASHQQTVPPIITPSFLTELRAIPNLPPDVWYFVIAVVLCALNRPDEIPKIFTYALENGIGPDGPGIIDPAEKLRFARRLREGLIKSAAVSGYPKVWLCRSICPVCCLYISSFFLLVLTIWLPLTYRAFQVINAVMALKTVTPPELLDEAGTSASGRTSDLYDTSPRQIMERGKAFFNNVYGKVAERVMNQMEHSGTEDLGLTARLMYGYVLSNTSILGPAETSYVLIAGLIPQDVSLVKTWT
jgi:hypothetical protein